MRKVNNKPVAFILFLVTVLIALPVFSGPPEDFKEAYLLIKEADSAAWQGETGPARDTYRRALGLLDDLSNRHPGWGRLAIRKQADHCPNRL